MEETVREFLQKPLTARLGTVDAKGYPHIIPLWFDVDGDDLIIISDRKTRKVDHIVAGGTKGAMQIGGDGDESVGYLFKGQLTVEPDPDFKWLRQVTLRYELGERAEKDIDLWRTTLDMIIIRLKVERVIKVL